MKTCEFDFCWKQYQSKLQDLQLNRKFVGRMEGIKRKIVNLQIIEKAGNLGLRMLSSD